MNPLRIGVAGVGHLGSHHARSWARLDGASLAGVVDPSPEARHRAATEFGVRTHESIEALLEGIDLLSIAAPTPFHAELALAAIERGIHVLVEKPMADSTQGGQAMLDAARRASVALVVGHIERFNPAVEAALPQVAEPRFIEAHRLAPPVNRGTDVDVMLDLMIHDLDLALLATRSRVTDVHAVGVPVLTPRIDIANARLLFDSGCVANLTASRISRERTRKIRFFASERYVSIDCLNRSVEAYTLVGGGESGPPRIGPLPVRVLAHDALERELRHALAAAREPARSWGETEIALEALRLAERISRQIGIDQPLGAPV